VPSEMKYSSTDRPSMKFALIGRLDDLALRVGHQATHGPRAARIWFERATSTGVGHHEDGVRLVGGCPSSPGGRHWSPPSQISMMLSFRPSSLARARGRSHARLPQTFASYSTRIASFVGGTTMSFFEIVTPAMVAYLNEIVLIVSSTLATAVGAVIARRACR